MRLDLSHSHTRHAVNQVKQYIEDVAKKEMHDRDRLLGVVWDGRVMVFVRYCAGWGGPVESLDYGDPSWKGFICHQLLML